MTETAIIAGQVIGYLSGLILAGAIGLVALRAGLGTGAALGVSLGMIIVGMVIPYALRGVGYSFGLPPELLFLAYPVCGLIYSGLALVVALMPWPRPQ